ncbi:16S rRNA (uracil(1498)-N(3))-methyltransferase [Mailhella sp.]|uniref:16S rRNA (uracil(1498)-N(3))-methyltransferase n=1 Tax=Mailhella sp. TaxID=1981029 RepID=UPI003AB156FE
MHTFYLPPEMWQEELELSGAEAHHMGRVLRLHPGDEVLVLDGAGREALCRILQITRQSALLRIIKEKRYPRPSSSVVLAVGWGKEARRGWILEKSVELEAAGLWFWQATRSQFPVPQDTKENWRASLVAGAKQCRNPWLPELRTLPGGVNELIRASEHFDHRQVLLESGLPGQRFMTEDVLGLPGQTLCVIGPEGGFTRDEAECLIQAGFQALSMGERVLRWETAAMMALGLHWWKRQHPGGNL